MKHHKGGICAYETPQGGICVYETRTQADDRLSDFFRPQEHPTQYLPKPCGPPYASTLFNCHFWVWHYWLSNWI